MAKLSLFASFSYQGLMLVVMTGFLLALGLWGARAAGPTVTAEAILQVVIGNTLWLAAAPLLNRQIIGTHASFFIAYMSAVMMASLGQNLLFHWGLGWAAILCGALIVLSHALFYFELKRRFATRDLVERNENKLWGRAFPMTGRS